MASLTFFVNTASSGGDGTTNGTTGTHAAFATLSAAEAATRQDLTAITPTILDEDGNATISLDIICTGVAPDTTAVTISSATWVSNSTHRLRIRCDQTNGATWNANNYKLVVGGGIGVVLNIDMAISITLQDIQIENSSVLGSGCHALQSQDFAWDIHIIRGFLRQTGTTGTESGDIVLSLQNFTSPSTLHMRNLTIGSAGSGVQAVELSITTSGSTVLLSNITIVNLLGTGTVFSFNIGTTGTFRFQNLLLQGAGTCYSVENHNPTLTNTIMTQDTTSPTTALRSKTCTFVNSSGWNFHELSSDPSVGVGTNLSSDANMPFNDDCDAVVRTPPWDVGADQFVSATIGTYDIFVSGVNLAYINLGVQHTLLGGVSAIATTYTPGQIIVANTNLVYCDDNGVTRIVPGANQGASQYTPGCLRIVGTNIRWTGVDGNEYAAISIVS